MTRQERGKKKRIYSILGKVFSSLLLLTFAFLIYLIMVMNILPIKVLLPIILVLGLFLVLFIYCMLNKKVKIGVKTFVIILSILCSLVNIMGILYINKTFLFFDKIKEKNYITEDYYVMVNINSNYGEIEDLRNKDFLVYNEKIEIYDKALSSLKEIVPTISITEANSVQNMAEELMAEKVDAIMISSVHKEAVAEELDNFIDSTKVIYTIKIKVKTEKVVDHEKIDVTKEPFTVLISGADSYGTISDRSRSDVNMLITVNTNTKEILMTSIPRDYYVQLHGTQGSKDKLTHAGIYGINKSVGTIEDFMGIDIDYYIKVNFSTLINVVDTIGGIDVYSDASFVPWTDRSLYIKKGVVHMDGKTAIAFARERHAYQEGDRHRVKNQQDVLSAIIKKVSNSTVLLTKYTKILDDLSDSFETNITIDEIASLVKLQINKMPSWNISKYSLNGSDALEYTYSFGNQKLYVMIPDENTIQKANSYIERIENGEKLSGGELE